MQTQVEDIETLLEMAAEEEDTSLNEEIQGELADLEKKYDDQFRIVFEVLNELLSPPQPPRKQIGFNVKNSVR